MCIDSLLVQFPSLLANKKVQLCKGYAKTNKDLGMSCNIQVEYSFFPAGSSLLTA